MVVSTVVDETVELASVFNVTAVALVPVDIISLGVEHGGDVRLDGNETVVVGLFKVIDDGRDVGLALTREDIFRFYLIIDGITTVLDVDVDDVLTHAGSLQRIHCLSRDRLMLDGVQFIISCML